MPMTCRFAVLLLLLVGGCAAGGRGSTRPAMLGPEQLRINPTFTRLADEGVQIDVELIDAFGDPTKGAGQLTFALFEYEASGDSIRGEAVGAPETFDLSTVQGQRDHWQSVVRTYRVVLRRPGLDASQPYLLEATYRPSGPDEPRLFDQQVLRPRDEQ